MLEGVSLDMCSHCGEPYGTPPRSMKLSYQGRKGCSWRCVVRMALDMGPPKDSFAYNYPLLAGEPDE